MLMYAFLKDQIHKQIMIHNVKVINFTLQIQLFLKMRAIKIMIIFLITCIVGHLQQVMNIDINQFRTIIIYKYYYQYKL